MTVTIKQLQIGRVGDNPQKLIINTNNTIAEVTTAGFLTKYGSSSNIQFSDYQLAEVYTTDGKVGIYQVSVDNNGIASLVPNTDGIISGSVVSGNLPEFLGTSGTMVDSGIASNLVLRTNIATPDTNVNLVTFDVTVTAAALASGASVTLYASTGAKQYKIRALWVNRGDTNFSGGGGDRLLSITDNTTVYSLVPAASLQTLANTGWGVTGLPFPASAAINTSTAAGASLVAKYSGGAADYSAGSVVISGLLQRVA